ncbi:NAD(P) transhydrogenase subunit alpha [Alphaproteobacteria bacterium]|nr:NAD(P) transhydrogenase subunit alpha [Alphaproteobacteria bacterium]
MPEQQKTLSQSASELAEQMQTLSETAASLATEVQDVAANAMHAPPFIITGLTVFVLACFVGYHVVWRVTPALHSPLMGITNAISSVIIVGALVAAGTVVEGAGFSSFLGFLGVVLASVNIFGGFVITRRMLHMFKKKGA